MILVVTGTDTGVGKTVVTAALAARAIADGLGVVVVKPLQTGVPAGSAEERDIDVVHRLTGCPVHQLVSLDDPLAPDTAARLRGVTIPPVRSHAAPIRGLADRYDLVLVEGAGGVLVRLDTVGGTVLDLADELGAPTCVVTREGLGTLNHTELTVRALREAGVTPWGLVIGSAQERPGLAERCNHQDLPRLTGVPIVGSVRAGAASLPGEEFCALAQQWLPDPVWALA